jgi:hypothetical protein
MAFFRSVIALCIASRGANGLGGGGQLVNGRGKSNFSEIVSVNTFAFKKRPPKRQKHKKTNNHLARNDQ